jgi:putative glutamine amidotransferase
MQPLIGITTSLEPRPNGSRNHTSFEPNALAIERAGGLPVLIPAGLDERTLRAIYERMDGIFVPGGGDVNPQCYGAAEQHPKTYGIVDARDTLEITLVQWAAQDDLPLLGVCRGHQVVNVALGGTLIQDIPSQVDTTINHSHRPEGVMYPNDGHRVNIDPGSRLAHIIGLTDVEVNTLHHQAVEQAAPGMCVTAYAPDGVVEALEMPDKRFLLSVQWHPEIMFDDERMQNIFRAFVDSTRQ